MFLKKLLLLYYRSPGSMAMRLLPLKST